MHSKVQWLALQIGVALFLIGGVFDAVIGAATPFLTRVLGPAPMGTFLISAQADMKLLGISPAQLLQNDSALSMYRAFIDLVGFLLLVFGSLQAGIAWFGLRQRESWALLILVAVDLVFISGWILVMIPYVQKGIPLSIFELPPNFLVPAFLLAPAAILSFLGLRTMLKTLV